MALQSVVVWGITDVKDFEGGDTMTYVFRAREYPGIIYSPMYTAALRIVLNVTGDAYAANVATRVIALLVIGALVMLVFRRFLSPTLSLVLLVIFAFNPGYVDALYTVHIWGMILPLIALVAVAYMPPAQSIPWTIALFAINAMVMRNEYILAALIFLVLLIYPGRFFSWRDLRQKSVAFFARTWFLWAAVLGVAILLILISAVPVTSETFRTQAEARHTLNVCQIYAYFRMESGDPRVVDPWTLCQPIMQADFGTPTPSITQAFLANPRAIAEMVTFNISLIPNGLQVLLTGGFFGGDSPDYWPQRTNFLAPVTTAALLLLAGRGAWALRGLWGSGHNGVTTRDVGSDHVARRGEQAFFMLTAAVLVLMVFIALSQRPRPSYIFLTTVIILLLVGIGITSLRVRPFAWIALAFVIGLAGSSVVTQVRHPLFGPSYVNLFYGAGQPVLASYRELQPQANTFPAEPIEITIVAPVDPDSLCHYLRRRFDTCIPVVGSDVTLTWTRQ